MSSGKGNASQESLDGSQPPPAVPRDDTAPSAYSRNLPHLQRRQATLFVTFATRRRWVLPDAIRAAVLKHCLHDNGEKLQMHAVVIMPDHVHLLFSPLANAVGEPFTLATIMSGIKGSSAHTVNRALARRGNVWEEESFDRLLRSDESIRQKSEYICANPVRAALVPTEDEWPWLWREWVEGRPEGER